MSRILLSGLTSRLRLAGLLVATGIGIELPTLFWNHPVSLFLFLFLGNVLIGGGMLLFLLSIMKRAK